MPIGEIYDLISIYQIANGIAEEVDKTKDMYIPNLR